MIIPPMVRDNEAKRQKGQRDKENYGQRDNVTKRQREKRDKEKYGK